MSIANDTLLAMVEQARAEGFQDALNRVALALNEELKWWHNAPEGIRRSLRITHVIAEYPQEENIYTLIGRKPR